MEAVREFFGGPFQDRARRFQGARRFRGVLPVSLPVAWRCGSRGYRGAHEEGSSEAEGSRHRYLENSDSYVDWSSAAAPLGRRLPPGS